METNSTATLLRIFIGSTDKLDHNLLGESIVLRARKNGMAGATLIKGVMGFGSSSVIHSYKFWEVSDKVPTIVEIIDDEEKILDFFKTIKSELDGLRYGCLVTTEKVNVLLYKTGKKKED
jgi:hypothetical protein